MLLAYRVIFETHQMFAEPSLLNTRRQSKTKKKKKLKKKNKPKTTNLSLLHDFVLAVISERVYRFL